MSAIAAPSLADAVKEAPRAGRPGARRLIELLADPRASRLQILARSPPVGELLKGVAEHSPFLWRLIVADPARAARLLDAAPDVALEQALAAANFDLADEAGLMRALRRARQEAALLIALADLGGVWGVEAVTAALTRAADVFVAQALRFALREAGVDPDGACGLVVLALGKHGAHELNYSSDVDLIVLFDPAAPALARFDKPAAVLTRVIKRLVRFLQERTGDGFVLRVDLRLRPDPASTGIVISLPAAFEYYETLGQNWERAALIKARPVAGDLALGARFLADLAPFIWRKYFDYGSIADIHAMKRQIHAARGHADVAVAGHDIKLGRGGIREIEFFVQTQQLIFGGRRPHLRGSRTLDMLAALHSDGWVTREAATQLAESYQYLRAAEHQLQMVNDEQTQRLPADPEALSSFARFCGYAGAPSFARALTTRLRRVEKHYARLFEHAPALDSGVGNLVFTGVVDDPSTLSALRHLGFRQPSVAIETVRGWHFGRRPAVRTARAREVLTELAPSLVAAFAASGDPDIALANFDQALSRMPAAVELFALLKESPRLRELFGDILGGAPRLARAVTARPHVLDGAIDPAIGDLARIEERVAAALARAATMEDFLDRARALAQEEAFVIGVRLFDARIEAETAALAYTRLAEALLRATLRRVEDAMAEEYGRVPGGRCIVIAMGKLGSREMTATSDLDLMLIYDFPADAGLSDGRRPLHALAYYARLTQRLVSALTVATRFGPLYEVDLRLRPSGGKGPLATQARGFLAYQRAEAETWEQMALTRARHVAGDPTLGRAMERAIRAILRQKRDHVRLAQDIAAMRRLVAREKGEVDEADLKLIAGGRLDIEFLQQYLTLRHGADHPQLVAPGNRRALEQAAKLGLIGSADAAALIGARHLYDCVIQIQRITLGEDGDPALAGEGVRRRLAAAVGLPDFAHLTRELRETRVRVRAIFSSILPLDPL